MICPRSLAGGLLLAAATLAGASWPAAAVRAEELASDWVEGFNSRTRLTAVRETDQGDGHLTAFVEIELPAGWKTYWKAPGESGVPPAFDWGNSENVEAASVLYPVPHRLVDKGGEVLGYKDRVAFPVTIKAGDPTRPVALDFAVQFGICKDICIPAEVNLTLDIPPGENGQLSDLAGISLARVPRAAQAVKPDDPVLKIARLDASSGKPRIVIEAEFPGGGTGADAFLEAPGGAYMPPLRKTSEDGARLTFEADVSQDVDLGELKGKEIGVTLAGQKGQSASSFVLQ